MPTLSLKAHFDGQHILLDEPFDLPSGAQLLVTVVSPDWEYWEGSHECWAAGSRAFERAYGDDEPEYSLADVRELA